MTFNFDRLHFSLLTMNLVLPVLALPAMAATVESYSWTELKPAPLSAFVRVTGRVVPQDGALNIESARIQGRVVNILAREGDRVRPGTPLLAINSAECTSLAEEKRVAEKRKITDLVDGVRRREAQLGLRVSGESCLLVATHNGTVTKRNIESGVAFNIGDALATVLDTKRLSVELDLAERDVSSVAPGQTVIYRLAANTEKSFTSQVRAVVPAIDSTSRTARVRLTAADLPPNASLDGLVFGEIENRSKDSVFTIPARALIFSKNTRFVVRGPKMDPVPVEVEVLGEASDQASIRPKRAGDLKPLDVVATDRALFLYRKLSEGAIQP